MNKILLGVIALFLISCEVDCEWSAKNFKEKECNIIVHDLPSQGRRFVLRGINPVSKRKQAYIHEDAWYLFLYKEIELNDTVVKRAGDSKMFIHKKDTVLVYQYSCDRKFY